MAIPLFCKDCHEVVGIESSMATLARLSTMNLDSVVNVNCMGKENHLEPIRSEKTQLFGLINQITVVYPETETTSSWEEYVGPKRKIHVWFAIVFGTEKYPNGSYRGILIDNKWTWWDKKISFYGDGAELLT